MKQLKDLFDYYMLEIKLTREMLGTCTEASIYHNHVLKKAQKMIKEANRMATKVKKAYEKYKGVELPPEKEVAEIQGIIRRYQEVLGKSDNLPDSMDDLLDYAQELEAEFNEVCKKGEEVKATVFMRDKEGHAIISSHMILGNLKENFKTMVNNTTAPKTEKLAKSKVSVQEMLTLDVKPVEHFIKPSEDVTKGEDGKPLIKERPIRFEDNFGNTVTAIAMSEELPIGTEFKCHLRVRKDSPINDKNAEALIVLFHMGKNNGLGQWRGSGGMGQYVFRLKKVDYDPTPIPEGWN